MERITCGVLGVLAVYLLFAFGSATFDISLWSVYARAMCAVSMAFAALAPVLFAVIGN